MSWNHVNCLVMDAFNYFDVVPDEQRFEYVDEFGISRKLSSTNWDNLVWNDRTQRIRFQWFPQSVITRICVGLQREYAQRDQEHLYEGHFTKFCENGL